jgi:anti-anti-sigma factor
VEESGAQAAFEVRPLDEGRTVVQVRGELDVSSGPKFQDALTDAVAASEEGVVIDLRECSFIDSFSIGALISARRALEARELGDPPMVIVARRFVARALKLAGIDVMIPVCSSVEGAKEILDAAEGAH